MIYDLRFMISEGLALRVLQGWRGWRGWRKEAEVWSGIFRREWVRRAANFLEWVRGASLGLQDWRGLPQRGARGAQKREAGEFRIYDL